MPKPSSSGNFTARGTGRLELLKSAAHYLQLAGVEDSLVHAELLLGHLLSLSRAELHLRDQEKVPPDELARFEAMVTRRGHGEPTQYIVGETEFYGLSLRCDRRALIPRPETELLVDAALTLATGAAGRPFSLCDLGTGSGCIAVSVAVNAPHATVVAVDLYPAALDLARENASRHGVESRIDLRSSDLFAHVAESFDVIAANLPYVPSVDRTVLQREVRDWEPASALFAGTDGLEFLEPAIRQAPDHLRPGGHLLLEIGAGQLAPVLGLIRGTAGFNEVTHRADYQGHPRVVTAVRS